MFGLLVASYMGLGTWLLIRPSADCKGATTWNHTPNQTAGFHDGCSNVNIPVVLLAYNNPTLLSLMVRQLRECFNATLYIIDNGSKFPPMHAFLKKIETDPMVTVWYMPSNFSPHVLFQPRGSLYMNQLPQFFALSDSDIRLGDNTPRNFLCVLALLTQHLNKPKVGLVLDLGDYDQQFPQTNFFLGKQSIYEHEKSLYTRMRMDEWPELNSSLFKSDTDTTFAVYNKQLLKRPGQKGEEAWSYTYDSVRLGGLFAAKHRPWYPKAFAGIPDEEVHAMFSGVGTMADFLAKLGKSNLSSHTPAAFDLLEDSDMMSYTCAGKHHYFHVPARIRGLDLNHSSSPTNG